MSNSHRAAALHLFPEGMDNAPVAPKDISEPHSSEFHRGGLVHVCTEKFCNALGRTHDTRGVDCLVC